MSEPPSYSAKAGFNSWHPLPREGKTPASRRHFALCVWVEFYEKSTKFHIEDVKNLNEMDINNLLEHLPFYKMMVADE